MSKPKTVLMIGGPADGRWMVAVGYDIIVAESPTLDWTSLAADPLAEFDIRRVHYHVERCHLFNSVFDVAVAQAEFRSSGDRNKAIIRALFQRDVATAMGAYR